MSDAELADGRARTKAGRPPAPLPGRNRTVGGDFCGIGGWAFALRGLGYRDGGHCDIDPLAVAAFNRNHPGSPARLGDASKPEKVAESINRDGGVDLRTGSPPCVGYTSANFVRGKSEAAAKSRRLTIAHAESYRYLDPKPKAGAMENTVECLKCFEFWRAVAILDSLGYDVHWAIFGAQYVKVPQRRKRVYIVAVLRGANVLCDLKSRVAEVIQRPPAVVRDLKAFS